MEKLYGVVDIYMDKLETKDMLKIFSFSFMFYVAIIWSSVSLFPEAVFPLILPKDHMKG